MKTRLKNRIAGFSREQLIDWICLSCVDIRSTHSAEDAQDMINDIREAIEIGFPAALTAQPDEWQQRAEAAEAKLETKEQELAQYVECFEAEAARADRNHAKLAELERQERKDA